LVGLVGWSCWLVLLVGLVAHTPGGFGDIHSSSRWQELASESRHEAQGAGSTDGLTVRNTIGRSVSEQKSLRGLSKLPGSIDRQILVILVLVYKFRFGLLERDTSSAWVNHMVRGWPSQTFWTTCSKYGLPSLVRYAPTPRLSLSGCWSFLKAMSRPRIGSSGAWLTWSNNDDEPAVSDGAMCDMMVATRLLIPTTTTMMMTTRWRRRRMK
jgi:hypothetical protein